MHLAQPRNRCLLGKASQPLAPQVPLDTCEKPTFDRFRPRLFYAKPCVVTATVLRKTVKSKAPEKIWTERSRGSFFCLCKTECPTHSRKKKLFGCSCSAGSLDHRCRLVSGVVPVIAFMRPAAHAPRAKRRSYERREAAKREGAAAQREGAAAQRKGSSSTARRGAAERD